MGERIGYERVSTPEQNTARQDALMKKLAVNKVYVDKTTGKYKGGKKKATDWERFGKLYGKWKAGDMTAVEFQRQMCMSAPTFYRRVKEYGATVQ